MGVRSGGKKFVGVVGKANVVLVRVRWMCHEKRKKERDIM